MQRSWDHTLEDAADPDLDARSTQEYASSKWIVGVLLDCSGSMLRTMSRGHDYPSPKAVDTSSSNAATLQQYVSRLGSIMSRFTNVNIFAYGCGLWLPEGEAAFDLFRIAKSDVFRTTVEAARESASEKFAPRVAQFVDDLKSTFEARAAANPSTLAEQVMGSNVAALRNLTTEQQRLRVQEEIERYIGECATQYSKSLLCGELVNAPSAANVTMTAAEAVEAFQTVSKSLRGLYACMGGLTPLRTALRVMRERFVTEQRSDAIERKQLLVVVSDGLSSDGDPSDEARALLSSGVEIVACLVSDGDQIPTRTLFSRAHSEWGSAAKCMFNLATPASASVIDFLLERGWTRDGETGSHLFARVNAGVIESIRDQIQFLVETEIDPKPNQKIRLFPRLKPRSSSGAWRAIREFIAAKLLRRQITPSVPSELQWRDYAPALLDADEELAMKAADRVEQMRSDAAIDDLVQALSHDSFAVRLRAAKALGGLHTPIAVPPLIAALGDPDYSVRSSAAKAVARLPFQITLDMLIRELNGRFYDPAIYALGLSADPKAVEPLLSVLKATGSAESDIRTAIAAALGRIGDKRGAAPLISLLDSDANDRVRTAAAVSLGQIADESAIQVLVRASIDPDLYYNHLISPRTYVVGEALAQFGTSAVDVMLRFTADYLDREGSRDDYDARISRAALARNLQSLKNSRVISMLIRIAAIDPYHCNKWWSEGFLRETYDDHRPSPAMEAIKSFGKEAVDAAALAVNDPDPKVGALAGRILEELVIRSPTDGATSE